MKRISLFPFLYKRILATLLLVYVSYQLTGQTITNYTFAGSNGKLTALSGPNTTSIGITPTATGSGSLNLAFRISDPGSAWNLRLKGGTIAVNTQGSSAAGIEPFNMDATGCLFEMSGGTMVIQLAGGNTG